MRVPRATCEFVAPGVVLLLGLATPLFGQFSARHSGPAQREMQAREWALTHVRDEVNKHFKKEQRSLFEQIREDFTRLQMINNEMMRTIFVKGNVDLKLIAATTTEINKRAGRLNENLALPRLDDKTKHKKHDEPGSDSGLQSRLLALDRCIVNFTTNPLFKQPKVIDAELALKARRDLELIIRLSKQLKTLRSNQNMDPTSPGEHPTP